MNRFVMHALLAALLAGCAAGRPALLPGQSEAEVLTAMGKPTGRYVMPDGGQRLEYAKGPNGVVTWMVDLDQAGRVAGIAQVLQQRYFDRVRNGMSRDDLLRLLGRPADRAPEWQRRETWSWRFDNYDCVWFRVTLSAQQRVLGGGSMMVDPKCDPRDTR